MALSDYSGRTAKGKKKSALGPRKTSATPRKMIRTRSSNLSVGKPAGKKRMMRAPVRRRKGYSR